MLPPKHLVGACDSLKQKVSPFMRFFMVGGGYEAIIKGRLKFFQIQCAQRVPGLPLSQSAPCITAG